jgi:hypothetical protein
MRFTRPHLLAAAVAALGLVAVNAPSAAAAVRSGTATAQRASEGERGGGALEAAAARAADIGRAVAMSLIGLALAVAATVLAFRRDFKEAAGVVAVGVVAVLLATPTGVALLRDTVSSVFGAG